MGSPGAWLWKHPEVSLFERLLRGSDSRAGTVLAMWFERGMGRRFERLPGEVSAPDRSHDMMGGVGQVVNERV